MGFSLLVAVVFVIALAATVVSIYMTYYKFRRKEHGEMAVYVVRVLFGAFVTVFLFSMVTG